MSRAAAKEPEDSVYRLYYEFSSPVSKTQGHQILAMNRGEREEILKVDVEMDRETALVALRRRAVPGRAAMEFVRAAAEDAYDRRAVADGDVGHLMLFDEDGQPVDGLVLPPLPVGACSPGWRG
mgnify:CR=1 FL=1